MRIISPKITLNPLFSCIISFYILILLYFPNWISLRILLSPVFVITGSILLYLLRLGSIQRENRENFSKTEETEFSGEEEHKRVGSGKEPESDYDASPASDVENYCKTVEMEYWDEEQKRVGSGKETESEIISEFDFDPNPDFEATFVEWDVRAPLEVIYEEEGEEEDLRWNIGRYAYPESESGLESPSEGDFPASWDWVLPEKMGLRWEEEDKEGMIEIAIEKKDLDFYEEEENWIEIDINSRIRL